MKTLKITTSIIISFILTTAFAQNPAASRLARSFRKIVLLEHFDSVMQKLKKDPLIMVDPSSDFGEFDEEDRNLIKAKLPPYLPNIYYQFYQKKLYVLSLFWNPKKISYLQLYRKLKKKYKKPIVFNSKQIIWEDKNTIIVLDNLPSIKYIDKKTFAIVKALAKKKKPLDDKVREKVLEDL